MVQCERRKRQFCPDRQSCGCGISMLQAKNRYIDAFERLDFIRLKPCRAGRVAQADQQVHNHTRLMRNGVDCRSMHLRQSANGIGRDGDEPSGCGFQKHPVIAYQPGKPAFGSGHLQQRVGKSGFPAAACADDQQATIGHQQSRGMNMGLPVRIGRSGAIHAQTDLPGTRDQLSAGSETTKRAPRISPGLVPGMFSADSLPPCASIICLLIDRPRPEFWPKSSEAGRSV